MHEEELAREAKILAAKNDTSVSQLLADYLEKIVQSEKQNLETKKHFFKLARKSYHLNYSKRTFHRDTLHAR